MTTALANTLTPTRASSRGLRPGLFIALAITLAGQVCFAQQGRYFVNVDSVNNITSNICGSGANGGPCTPGQDVAVTLTTSNNPVITLYLDASPNALLGPAPQGTAYAFQIAGSAVTLYQFSNGTVTTLASTTIANQTYPITFHAFFGYLSNGYQGLANLYAQTSNTRQMVLTYTGLSIWNTGSQQLVGYGYASYAPSGLNPTISPADSGVPTTPGNIQTYTVTGRTDILSSGCSENGSGIYEYLWYRNNSFITGTEEPEFSDVNVQPNTPYQYTVSCVTFNNITSAANTFNVTTPPQVAFENRRVGVNTTGSYWGGMGEQIDVRSGNLNFSYPLVAANGRASSVPIGLNYNSQNWRLDQNTNTWNLVDVKPAGFGWNLQVGSLKTFWSNYFTVHHYEFQDASGTTYRLGGNNNGLWYSTHSVYVWYDSTTSILHFRDGSSWQMGCLSADPEPDAGVLYPTLIEDSNGNQITIAYDKGGAFSWPNASGRITSISDSRGAPAYTLSYTQSPSGVKLVTSLANSISSGESFTFTYTQNVTLHSPFSPGGSYGATDFLTSITNNATSLTTTFAYDSANSGELDKVTFPYGGYIGWQYGTETLEDSRSLREVTNRSLYWSSTPGVRSYTLTRDSNGLTEYVPQSRTLVDQNANATKVWTFSQLTDYTEGLVTSYSEQQTTPSLTLRLTNYTWTSDSAGNEYISQIQTISDPGQTYSVTKQVGQTLDQYGNVTLTKLYNFSNLSTAAKTYNNTYWNSGVSPAAGAANSAYILNRLLTSTVTDGTNNFTLVSNVYDQYSWNNLFGAPFATQLDSAYTQTSYPYIPRGNVTSSTHLGSPTVNYSYDVTGTVVGTSGAFGGPTSVTTGTATNYAAPTAVTTGNSLTTSLNWNSFLATTQSTGPNGELASTAYDPTTGRPTSTTSPYGATTTYAYSNTAPQVTATTSGHWTKTYYDGLGRPNEVDRGYGSITVSSTNTVYDTCGCTPLGKPVKTSLPYAPGNTPVWTVKTYDAIGRTLTTIAPDGASTTRYSYQGNVVTITDPAGHYKKYTMDAFGELTQVMEQGPGTDADHKTTYAYDLLGHLTTATLPRTVSGTPVTQTRTWTYSPTTALLSSKTSPEAGTVNYTYNADGSLNNVTDAKNQRKQYTYDSFGRVTQIARGTMTGSTFTENVVQRTTYTYDQLPGCSSNCNSGNTLGRLAQVNYKGPNNHSFVETYTYTTPGQVEYKNLVVDSFPTILAEYGYDSVGNLLSYSAAGGTGGGGIETNYLEDSMGRPNYFGSGLTQFISNVTYGPSDEVLSISGGSLNETRTYVNGQLTQLVSNAPGNAGFNFTYTYPATQNNGRVQSITDNSSGETIQYFYDSLNRLIQASATGDAHGAWTQQFTYDGFGNLTQKMGTNAPNNVSINVDPTTNRLTGNSALYDANGNLTQYTNAPNGNLLYAYDIENRLASASVSGSSTATVFGYDSSNQRVYKATYNSTSGAYSNEQVILYGPDGKKLGIWQISGTSLTNVSTNLWFMGRLLKPQDRLNSIGKYFPYGEDRYSPSPANPPNGQEKFATYTRDAETGLDYAYQRYYTAGLGRFMTPDIGGSAKTGAPQGLNRYAYVSGDPMSANDPTGMDGCDVAFIRGLTGPSGNFCPSPSAPSGDPSDITAIYVPDIANCIVGTNGLLSNDDGSECGDFSTSAEPQSDCKSQFPKYEISFVETNYKSAFTLELESHVPSEWILGWAAQESGWGLHARGGGSNYFGWRGKGDHRCKGKYGCFNSPGFLHSGAAALFGHNYFSYGGVIGVTAASILYAEIKLGHGVEQAFNSLRAAGYTFELNYGNAISKTTSMVYAIEQCLFEDGELP